MCGRQHGKNKQQLSAQFVKHPNQNPAKPARFTPESNMLSTMLSSDVEELYQATYCHAQLWSCCMQGCQKCSHLRLVSENQMPKHWQVGLQNLTEMFWNLHMELSAVRKCWMFYIECHQVRRKDEKSTFGSDRSQYILQNVGVSSLVIHQHHPKAPLALSHREANWQADNHWSGPAPPDT